MWATALFCAIFREIRHSRNLRPGCRIRSPEADSENGSGVADFGEARRAGCSVLGGDHAGEEVGELLIDALASLLGDV